MTYLWSLVVSLPNVAMTSDAIGADSAISPLNTDCMNTGALSLRSSTCTMASHVAEAPAILVVRIVRL